VEGAREMRQEYLLDTMGTQEIAESLNLSRKYVQNNWPEILPGIKPVKPNCRYRQLRFARADVRKLLAQPK
jgi:hypothetical protein